MTVIDVPLEKIEAAAESSRKDLSNRWASMAALLIAVLWTIPTAGLLVTSFRPENDINTSGWWTVVTNPSFTLDNYKAVLSGGSEYSLTDFFVNSIVITIPAVVIPISIATMAAYAFAWMRFPLKNTIFILIFALQIVPIQVTMIPLLRLYVKLGLAGNDAPGGGFYTIWLSHAAFALPLAIYLLHNFMLEIPGELVESAKVDGAGHVQIFTRLILPLMMPAIARSPFSSSSGCGTTCWSRSSSAVAAWTSRLSPSRWPTCPAPAAPTGICSPRVRSSLW